MEMEGNHPWSSSASISSSKSPRILLAKIRELTRSLVKDLSEGRPPTISIAKFRNYCAIPNSSNCLCSYDMPKRHEVLTLHRECHVHRIDVLLRVLLIVQRLLVENRHGSKRDIFYMHPSVFKEQSVVDRAINDICILLQCSRHNLNVVSVGKGLVMGWLQFGEGGRKFDCISCPNTAHPIPVHIEDVQDIVSVAEYILVVEKESVFQRLSNDRFCNANRCIVITGRGYPDIPTRRFLRLLVKKLRLPIYCLVDCDPYGFDILTTYRFGSMQMAYDAKFLRVPDTQWLGAFPSDSEGYSLPQQCLLPLTAEDKKRIEAMLLRCYLQKFIPQWRSELELMLQRGVKFEIEALCTQSLSFLSEHYIPSKTCSLKVNPNCDGCKMKVMEVMHNLKGIYNVSIDTDQGIVKVEGKVNPQVMLGIFNRYGKHGEVTSLKFEGSEPPKEPRPSSYPGYGPNANYDPYDMMQGYCPPPYYPGYGAGPEYLWFERYQHFPPPPSIVHMPFPPPTAPPALLPSQPPPAICGSSSAPRAQTSATSTAPAPAKPPPKEAPKKACCTIM